MIRQGLALAVCLSAVVLILSGCQRGAPSKAAPAVNNPKAAESEDEAEIKANLAKLSPEDRKLAEAQKYCAVQGKKNRLGFMGPPVKVMLKGEPVYLCCKNCKKKAGDHPDETLARAKGFMSQK